MRLRKERQQVPFRLARVWSDAEYVCFHQPMKTVENRLVSSPSAQLSGQLLNAALTSSR